MNDPTPGSATPLPAETAIALTVNGVQRQLNVAPWTTLLDALREHLGLTGTKKGCDHGQCGACTVLVNGTRINSCLSLAVMHDGEREAGIDPAAVHQHRAGAALAVIAALLGAGQIEMVPQRVQQSRPRRKLELPFDAVDGQR